MLIFVDDKSPVPAQQTGWARCGHLSEGTDPFRQYIDGREVVDVLPENGQEGEEHELSVAGGSGWYSYRYRWEAGRWAPTSDNAPWQMKA